jgi:HlyD family secretion protein
VKRFFMVLIVLLVAAGVIVGAVAIYRATHDNDRQNDIVLYGNVDLREIRLAFQVSGRIASIHVEEGAVLSNGDTVAELDPDRYRLRVREAEALVKGAELALAKLRAGTRVEEINAARARLRKAQAVHVDADRQFERIQELERTDFASEQKLDDARAALDSAKATVDVAQQELDLAVKGPREEDVAIAEATLHANRIRLDLAKKDEEDCVLTVPADGIVRERLLEPGDMASPRSPVLTVALTDPVWVRAYVPEPLMGRLAPGMDARVTTDSFPGRQYRAEVTFISPTAEFTPKSVQSPELRTKLVYEVRLRVPEPENQLRLGMPVTVHVNNTADNTTEPGDKSGTQ